MDCRWITEIREFNKLACDWDEALVSSKEDNPFLLSDFILVWWKHYCQRKKISIFAVFDNGRIIAGIPLCITKRKTRNTLEHIGGCAANVTHFFSIDKNLNFADCLLTSLNKNKDWDILVLDRVLEKNPLIGNIEERLKTDSFDARLRYKIMDKGFNGLIDLRDGYDSVLSNLPHRLYRNIKIGKRKARLIGELRLDRIQGRANIKRLFEEYREMSIKSFRSRNSISAFENDIQNSFFAELLEIFDAKGVLEADRLTLADKTLAISFAYRFGRGFKWILQAFNPDFHKLGPGHLLIDALVKRAVAKGDPYFDMYYGGEIVYKQRWCNKMIPLIKITVYRNNLVNSSFLWIENVLRSNKIFMNSARRIRKFIIKKKISFLRNHP